MPSIRQQSFIRSTLIICLIVGGIWFLYQSRSQYSDESNTNRKDPAQGPQSANDQSLGQFLQPVVFGSLHDQYDGDSFSFQYADGFTVSRVVVDSTSEVVVVENRDGTGFQIFSSLFSDSLTISPEQILQSDPEADIVDPKRAALDGIEALVFYGYNEDMGETFEVWSVARGRLYQIAGPKAAEDLIIKTLETWKWK